MLQPIPEVPPESTNENIFRNSRGQIFFTKEQKQEWNGFVLLKWEEQQHCCPAPTPGPVGPATDSWLLLGFPHHLFGHFINLCQTLLVLFILSLRSKFKQNTPTGAEVTPTISLFSLLPHKQRPLLQLAWWFQTSKHIRTCRLLVKVRLLSLGRHWLILLNTYNHVCTSGVEKKGKQLKSTRSF